MSKDNVINFPPRESTATVEEIRLEKYTRDSGADFNMLSFTFRMSDGKLKKASIMCHVDVLKESEEK